MQIAAQLNRLRDWLASLQRKHALILLSVAVGMAAGLVAVILKNAVYGLRRLLTNWFTLDEVNWLYAIYPAIGIALTLLIIRWFLKNRHPGPGIPTTLYAISRRSGQLKKQQMYASIVTSIFTVGFGGSAGLEAPAVQASAGIGSNLAALFHQNYKTRILLIGCAAAGSLAAMFKAPVAAIVFAVEVIMIDLTTASLVPLLMASLSALLTASLFLEEDVLLSIKDPEPFTFGYLPFYILLGVACGVFSGYFNKIYLSVSGTFQGIKSPVSRVLTGGALLGAIVLVFPPLYGEGYDILNAFLRDDIRESTANSMFYDLPVDGWWILLFLTGLLVLKVLATGITLGSGGVGGIFAPTLFMGGTLGYLFGKVIDKLHITQALPVGSFALVGMAGLMAGVLHAPLTSIFLIAEISGGYDLFVPLMISAAIAYYISRIFSKHTIYTRELAERGDLITHNKDQTVLTLMNLRNEIETNFKPVSPQATLRELVKIVSSSQRNLFPVVNADGKLVGVVTLDDIREIMFNTEMYDNVRVTSLMNVPPAIISLNERMEEVARKFDESGAWNLPVVDDHGIYAGFVSKSRIFSVYRQILVDVS
ncbi:MAG: CBS domain-containing protein [Cryomorphaceae bacterium]|nr:CBS domain-containing protein [Cryomorphaceae bacterium]